MTRSLASPLFTLMLIAACMLPSLAYSVGGSDDAGILGSHIADFSFELVDDGRMMIEPMSVCAPIDELLPVDLDSEIGNDADTCNALSVTHETDLFLQTVQWTSQRDFEDEPTASTRDLSVDRPWPSATTCELLDGIYEADLVQRE